MKSMKADFDVLPDLEARWNAYLKQRERCTCGSRFAKLRVYLTQWQCLTCGKLQEVEAPIKPEAAA